ncbi:heme ABC exporter ATP-binding protein CcmA [Parvularcula sp. ZS-1/3]|uniref:Heme ABC exporter ATP-binding protein CcmA n=1 Tax=Parvularcula mediterranea TaxID=2732508 RepID=A0A7Y3RKT6_9PROT|nr:heme ABC exporter ATP-binding protein CcmA [Parvularcula mediterranea]NNU15914.1 heme ABC exporter ATP-binding protein CcmA [Parvularcula mediterranea]
MAFEMALSLKDVEVSRAGRPVLAGVSMHMAPGSAVMVRGTNGSGKTSLLRAVAGLARHEGEIYFTRGVQVLDPAFMRSEEIHLVTPDGGHNPRLTVEETAQFESGFYGGDAEDALLQLGLVPQAEERVGALSTGQRRRLSLLRLLIDKRALWLLDEPFSGLDEEGRSIVRTLIEAHRSRGGVVLIALHDEEDIPGARTLRVEAA